MTTSIRRRLDALERHTSTGDSASTIAIVHVGLLGSSLGEIDAAADGLSWPGRYSAYLLPGTGNVLEPTRVDALNAADEQRWFDAAATYPHVLAVIDGRERIVFRFESRDVERRFDNLPTAEKEALLVSGDGFVWVK